MKPVFDKSGLLTTVVCDARTNKVLMVAWMNEESYALTKKTHQTWFWSRSRQKLWHKGEESGNTQEVVSMTLDCDFDTLLVSVKRAFSMKLKWRSNLCKIWTNYINLL